MSKHRQAIHLHRRPTEPFEFDWTIRLDCLFRTSLSKADSRHGGVYMFWHIANRDLYEAAALFGSSMYVAPQRMSHDCRLAIHNYKSHGLHALFCKILSTTSRIAVLGKATIAHLHHAFHHRPRRQHRPSVDQRQSTYTHQSFNLPTDFLHLRRDRPSCRLSGSCRRKHFLRYIVQSPKGVIQGNLCPSKLIPVLGYRDLQMTT